MPEEKLKTYKCGKCDDGSECVITIPEHCDCPIWCPFGLYPDNNSIDDFQANWKEQKSRKIGNRRSGGEKK